MLNVQPPSAMRHSGFGIASFVVALAVGLVEFLAVGVAVVGAATNPSMSNPKSPLLIMLGLVICAGLVVNMVGIALGVIGLGTKNRRKPFAVLGVAFNAALLVGIVALMVIGNMK